MKFCPNCGAALSDDATFCGSCGNALGSAAPNSAPNSAPNNVPAGGYAPNPGYTPNPGYSPNPGYAPNPGYPGYAPVAPDPYDHTAEFEAKDISDNKVICMMLYLAGYIGILIAAILSKSSKYVEFHLHQALKVEVIATLCLFVPILGVIGYLIMKVIAIICFFQVCGGKAKEAAIVRSLDFLK